MKDSKNNKPENCNECPDYLEFLDNRGTHRRCGATDPATLLKKDSGIKPLWCPKEKKDITKYDTTMIKAKNLCYVINLETHYLFNLVSEIANLIDNNPGLYGVLNGFFMQVRKDRKKNMEMIKDLQGKESFVEMKRRLSPGIYE